MTCSVTALFWVQEEGKKLQPEPKPTKQTEKNITLDNFIWNQSWSWECSKNSLQSFHAAWKAAKQVIYQLAHVSEQYLWGMLTYFFQKKNTSSKKG